MAKEKVEKKEEVKKTTKKTETKTKAKSTTTKKAEKVDKKEDTVESVVEDKAEDVKEEPVERRKAINIDLNDMIPVRSVTKGGLNYVSRKTNMIYRWQNYGDIEYIEFAELMTMKSSKPKYLTEPYMVIDDMEVVEKLGLTKLYEDMFDVSELDDFFKLSVTKMEEALETMPSGIKTLVRDKAVEKIKNETLYDLRKIKLLEDKVRVDLQIIMD